MYTIVEVFNDPFSPHDWDEYGNLGADYLREIDPFPSLREKCSYSEFFWTLFSRIWT